MKNNSDKIYLIWCPVKKEYLYRAYCGMLSFSPNISKAKFYKSKNYALGALKTAMKYLLKPKYWNGEYSDVINQKDNPIKYLENLEILETELVITKQITNWRNLTSEKKKK